MKLATKLFPTINNDRNVQENNTSNKEINQLTTITHHSKEIKKTNQTNRNPLSSQLKKMTLLLILIKTKVLIIQITKVKLWTFPTS